MPGLVVTSRNAAPTARLLQETFSVYALDLPGFGKSDKPAKVLSVPQLATALLEWMDAAGLPDAHLLGNSFGCQVIVEAACRHPERVYRSSRMEAAQDDLGAGVPFALASGRFGLGLLEGLVEQLLLVAEFFESVVEFHADLRGATKMPDPSRVFCRVFLFGSAAE